MIEKPLEVGTAVEYAQASATLPPWRVEKHYGHEIYLIGTATEFCDLVPRSMLRPINTTDETIKETADAHPRNSAH